MQNHTYLAPSLENITNFTSTQYLPLHKQNQNFSTLQRKIKLIKYPTLSIKPVASIDQFITHAKSNILERNLRNALKIENNLNFIRRVRGDGNCFVRAVAFQFLSQINSTKVEKCFPYLDCVVLTISDKQYVPKNLIEYYDDDFLSYCLKQNWQVQYTKNLKKYNNSHRVALAALFAQNPYLDFITILYMRAISVLALEKFSQNSQIRQFLQDNEKQKLRNYGNLSDGLSHFLFNKLLSMEINIFQVRNQQIIPYTYPVPHHNDEKYQPFTATLLYHHNHYDLLQKQADLMLQKKTISLNRKQSYYSEKQQARQLVQGQCINCEQLKMINVENCLCEGCYVEYQRAMREFKSNRKIDAKKDDQQLNISDNYNGLRISSRPTKRLKTDTVNNSHKNEQKNKSAKSSSSKRRKLFSCFG